MSYTGYDSWVFDGLDRMTARNYTVSDLLDQMTKTDLTRNTIEQYAQVIDRERFLCEERLGATRALTSQLNSLVHFLLDRLLPLMIREDGTYNESWVNTELDSFVHTRLDGVSLAHEFVYASPHSIRDSLRPIQMDLGAST